MKNLLFILCLVASTTLFYSCGDDDNTETPQTQTETEIVQNSIKGKFYNTGIRAYKFNDKTVDMWSNIVNGGEYYQYANLPYKVYTEKQYIVIQTTPETLLYYGIVGNNVYLYTDAEKKNNITNTEKPKELENQSKEPNKEDGTIILSPETHYTLFTDRTPNPIDGHRKMYVFEKGNDKQPILTFHWYSYQRMSEIKNIDPMENKSLFRTDMDVWIKKIEDIENNVYASNTSTKCEVKILYTGRIVSTGMYQTTFSIHLEDEPNHVKYGGTIDMEYGQYE